MMIEKWCNKYDKETIAELNMAIHKETSYIITRATELIRKCLSCKDFKEWCNDTWKMVQFLEVNRDPTKNIKKETQ